ncbi:MAG: CDP-diacylglycerol--glycerol-3-phosphate 3-phosphatidyltransferase [Candidatus Ventricola sp.]
MKKIVKGIMELNLPNKLTLLRMVMVPVYLVLLACGWDLLALIVFAAASLTDMLDGKIARSRNLVTNFGKFMDPIADKLLTHTAFIMLCSMGRLNVVACIIFIAREFVVSGLRLVAVEQGHVIAAGMSGKIKTVLQMALVMLLTITSGNLLTDAVMLAAAAMTLYSMGEYVWQNRAVLDGAK